MSRLGESFGASVTARRGGFIPFLVAGDPDLETTAALLPALSELNPVAIEVGVPFSDPTADGPVIQRAAQRSLTRGTSLTEILFVLKQSGPSHLAPLVLFTYYNPILQFGIDRFAQTAAKSGVAGVLVVDLPPESAGALHVQLRRKKIDLILLVTPTTTDGRLEQIARMASGFVYAVARTGVTGTARELKDESQNLVARIRAFSDLPVAVGFGITTRAQAKRVCRYADAAIVGSRLVAEIEAASAVKPFRRKEVVRAAVERAREFAR